MKLILFVLVGSYMTYAQCLKPFSGSFSVIDSYFDEMFVSDYNQSSVSYKLTYPGFKSTDSSRQLGFGYINDHYYSLPNSSAEIPSTFEVSRKKPFQDLYAWGETSTRLGKFGGWLGNVGVESNKRVDIIDKEEEKEKQFKGRNALWFLPHKKMWFAGASILMSGLYFYDKEEANSNTRKSYNYSELNQYTFQVNSMFRLTPHLFGRAVIHHAWNTYDNNSSSTSYTRYSSSNTKSTNSLEIESKLSSLSLSMLTQNGLEVGIQAYLSGNEMRRKNTYRGTYSYSNRNEREKTPSGAHGFGVWFQDGTKKEIGNHSLYFGVAADLCVLYQHEYQHHLYLNDVFDEIDGEERSINSRIGIPVVAEAGIYKKQLFAFFKFIPEFRFDHRKEEDKTKDTGYNLDVNQLSIGLRGSISQKFGFALIPDLTTKPYISGLDLFYSF